MLARLAILAAAVTFVHGDGPRAADGERRPAFTYSISRIDPEHRQRMNSWRPGCPVHWRKLRVVRVRTWGFDGRPHFGRLMLHQRQARRIAWVMRVLYRRK